MRQAFYRLSLANLPTGQSLLFFTLQGVCVCVCEALASNGRAVFYLGRQNNNRGEFLPKEVCHLGVKPSLQVSTVRKLCKIRKAGGDWPKISRGPSCSMTRWKLAKNILSPLSHLQTPRHSTPLKLKHTANVNG